MKKRIIYGGILASALLSFPLTPLIAASTHSDVIPVTHSDVIPVTHSDVIPVTHSDVIPVTHSDVIPVTHSDVIPLPHTYSEPLPPTTDAILNGPESKKEETVKKEEKDKKEEKVTIKAEPLANEPPNVIHQTRDKSVRN